MPYIGRSPEYGGLEKQLITADSSTTSFALTYVVGSESSILVSVAGVLQQPGTAYNLTGGGANIVFTAAPTTGSNVFVVFLGTFTKYSAQEYLGNTHAELEDPWSLRCELLSINPSLVHPKILYGSNVRVSYLFLPVPHFQFQLAFRFIFQVQLAFYMYVISS